MADVFLGLGSNVGDREANITQAIESIDFECTVLARSKIYLTEPVGYKDQAWFLNCAIEVECKMTPRELLKFLKSVEAKMGRQKTRKDGPRVIDIDILFFDDRVIKTKTLTVPHPRLHRRRFVLAPLAEICPDHGHPLVKKTVKAMLRELKPREKVEVFRAGTIQDQR